MADTPDPARFATVGNDHRAPPLQTGTRTVGFVFAARAARLGFPELL